MNDVENEEANRLMAIFNAFKAPNGFLSNQNYARKRERKEKKWFLRVECDSTVSARKVRMRKSKQKKKKLKWIYLVETRRYRFAFRRLTHKTHESCALYRRGGWCHRCCCCLPLLCRFWSPYWILCVWFKVEYSQYVCRNIWPEFNRFIHFIVYLKQQQQNYSILTNCSIRNVFGLNIKKKMQLKIMSMCSWYRKAKERCIEIIIE